MFSLSDLSLALAAAAVLLVPPLAVAVWWLARRQRRSEEARTWAEARSSALEQALAAAPDGWYAWFHGAAIGEDDAATSDTLAGGLLAGGLCSRRLAVLLSLYAGRRTGFADALAGFANDDARQLIGATMRLRRDGDGFALTLTHGGPQSDGIEPRRLYVSGIRAVSDDGTPLADLVWMRDITDEESALQGVSDESHDLRAERDALRAALDAVPQPVWLRDDGLRIVFANRAFRQAVEADGPDDLRTRELELGSGTQTREMRALASAARAAGEPRSAPFHVVLQEARRLVDVTEAPVGVDGGGRFTVGQAIDQTRLETLRSTLEREVASHATVLERLGTAIAIYGPDTRLRFHNTAYTQLWRLEDDWLDDGPTYGETLEAQRANRLLPEVADWPAFKDTEVSRFKSLLEPVEDLLHLPDGRTLRRLIAPHPLGGLLLTHEDVTDRLSIEAGRNTLLAVQRETLSQLAEAVAVFGADGRLRQCNPAFQSLWHLDDAAIRDEPALGDLMAALPDDATTLAAWDDLRAQLAATPQDRAPRRRQVVIGGQTMDCACLPLPDGGAMITARECQPDLAKASA